MMLLKGLYIFVAGCILGIAFGTYLGASELYRRYPCTESVIIDGHPECLKYERKEMQQ